MRKNFLLLCSLTLLVAGATWKGHQTTPGALAGGGTLGRAH